jgi:putative ATP-binding cassette transporter
MANVNLTWVSAGYGWLVVVIPIIVAAPAYFSGGLTFGQLMMSVGAFNQVNTALRWYVSNFGPIAEWRATLMRVTDFRQALTTMGDDIDLKETDRLRAQRAGHADARERDDRRQDRRGDRPVRRLPAA